MTALVKKRLYSFIPLFPFFLVAKSRDVSHNKLDSEVVPKVARMTVSGKKQTMGFDVPRYLTHNCSHMVIVLIKQYRTVVKAMDLDQLHVYIVFMWCRKEKSCVALGFNSTPLSSAQGRTVSSLRQW